MRIRRVLSVAVPVVALAFAGCASKPKNGECTKSEDCADQQGFGKVCVDGHCQECGGDADCKAGFVCRSLRCVPRPECERAEDCGQGKTCEGGRCVAMAAAAVSKPECVSDAECGSGKSCEAGKCVAKASECPEGGGALTAVYFAFDQAVLTPEARANLEKDAQCIKQRGFTKLVIEGNCDERGTTEYNIQLGQRRAEAAKKFLLNLGVSARAIKTVSYGKERPICPEQTEDCWSRCRRDDVVAH